MVTEEMTVAELLDWTLTPACIDEVIGDPEDPDYYYLSGQHDKDLKDIADYIELAKDVESSDGVMRHA